MKNFLFAAYILLSLTYLNAQTNFEQDIFKTGAGDLKMTFIGHGTLMFELNGTTIHIDPVGRYADYTTLPKADLILITHQHGDHLDPAAIGQILKDGTEIFCNTACLEKVPSAKVLKNGDKAEYKGISIEAVPAYNLVHKRDNGNPFHPKGEGNGYVLTIGGNKIYIAGDTENIPEMKDLKKIDIAFLPMNLPYTMTPQMVADAAASFNPKILYPYHYGNTQVDQLKELMKENKECEIRIRKMQ